MTTPQHPKRCETCDYYRLEPEYDECMICNHPNFLHDVFMHEIRGFEFDRIEKMGCASHSDIGHTSQHPVFNHVVFEDRLCQYLAVEFPSLGLVAHNAVHDAISQIADDCDNQLPSSSVLQLLESPEHDEGVILKLCECGNDIFRIIETADYLPEYAMWEGDEVLRLCTKCGRELPCINDVKNVKSLSRKALAVLRQRNKPEVKEG